MDLSGGSEDHSNYHSSILTSDWQLAHQIDPSSIGDPMNPLPMGWNQSIHPDSCFNGGSDFPSASQSPMKRKINEHESASTKGSAKKLKDGSDGAEEDYVHMRARRGQATNSHSLAERVRREKISERMKLLQDLVPGCSKVIGKAVMLDEIINYVQSLQRQVEFLSMKLAAVNPRMDFSIEGLLSKDLLCLRGGSSAVGNFSPEMICPQLQRGLFQAAIPGIGNPSNALRRAINSQATAMNGPKEHLPQMPYSWEKGLHNDVEMNFAANSSFNSQELNTKTCDGFP